MMQQQKSNPMQQFIDTATKERLYGGYPHTDIRYDDQTQETTIEISVPGFHSDDLSVELFDGIDMVVTGKQMVSPTSETVVSHYKGIARDDFVKQFALARGANIKRVSHKNGILTIILTKEPRNPVKKFKIDA